MTEGKTFTRFQARRRGIIRRASLWDAGDYVLSVNGSAFSERYRRFYYRDIKAIVVQKGPRMGSLGALVLLAFGATFFGIVAATSGWGPWANVFWLAPCSWLGAITYVNVARSCRVFIYTAVSSEELPAILRRSAAGRVVPQLLEKIREVQGNLVVAPAHVIPESAGVRSDYAVAETAATVPRRLLYVSASYFAVLLMSAAFAFWYRSAVLTPGALTTAKVLFCLVNAMAVLSGVWALMGVFKVRQLMGLRIAIVAGLGLLAVRTYALYMTVVVMNGPAEKVFASLGVAHWREWIGTGDCAMSLLIGVAGLVILLTASRGGVASSP